MKMKNMVQEEIRKGPWTEHEDLQLNCFVGLFGDRRWDFIAKVSGLNRTGKSCRLRWVNYLHPGLKRGKMSSQEERLVLELHSKWGNRWSRIAGKIPGRTDNEIKNYWRTHMRKKAQEKKRALCRSSSSLSSSYQSCSSSNVQTGVESFYDTGGHQLISASKGNKIGENQQEEEEEEEENGYSMDDIWKEIILPEVNNIEPVLSFYDGDGEVDCSFSNCPVMASPTWEYCSNSIWQLDDEQDSKMFSPTSIDQQFFSCYEYEREPLTG